MILCNSYSQMGMMLKSMQDEWIREGELAIFRGKGILGLIGCGPDGYPADGKIVADNDKCFNKWSQCPLRVRFPKNVDDRVKVLEYFDFLSSKCGRKWSAKFEYLDNPVLPREE